MASTINASTSSGIVQTADTSGVLQLQTAGTTAVTVDSSQRVGIGTTSPGSILSVYKPTGEVFLTTSTNTVSWLTGITSLGNYAIYSNNAQPIAFSTNATEAMRIASNGQVLIGTTSSAGTATVNLYIKYSTGTTWQVGPASAGTGNSFYVLNSGDVGVALDTGTTSWRTNSDERLKTDLKPIENGINKVTSLRSVTGRFKTDEETVSRAFLIAQDVQNVLPEAISIQDDELGTLGIRYTEVIPLLVAAIKEQQALITSLTARITALEGAK